MSRFPWLLELGAILLSTLSLSAVVAVLASQQGKAVTEWNFPTSINTVVAVLGAISKATLAFAISACIGQHKWNMFRAKSGKLSLFETFDSASRGPWGGFWLILRTKGKNWAGIGALVLIISLAVDPFMQAAVTLSGSVSEVDDASSAPVLPDGQRIAIGSLIPTQKGFGVIAVPEPKPDFFRQEFDFGLTSAIYDGLSNSVRTNARSPQVSFQCATGNCTWPVLTAPGVCSTCNDVTPSLSMTQESYCYNKNGSDQNVDVNINMEGPCTTFTSHYGHIRQFDGFRLTPYENYTIDTSPGLPSFTVFLTTTITMDYTKTISFNNWETMFLTYLVMRISDEFLRNETTWEDSSPTATECGLYFCAKAYDSRVENGELVEDQLGEWAVRDPKSWRLNGTSSGHEAFMKSHPSLDRTEHYRTDLVVTIPDDEVTGIGSQVATRFNISQATITGLQDAIESLTMDTSMEVDEDGNVDTIVRPLVFPPSIGASYNYPLGQILWNSTNLTAEFDRLANRLTVEFRENLPTSIDGSLLLYRLHIKVQWEYIVLPVVALVVGLVYVASVIIHTRSMGLPVWKEDAYPMMAYGFDDRTQGLLRSLDDETGPTQKLKDDLRIGLAGTNDGMRLEIIQNSEPPDQKEWLEERYLGRREEPEAREEAWAR